MTPISFTSNYLGTFQLEKVDGAPELRRSLNTRLLRKVYEGAYFTYNCSLDHYLLLVIREYWR